MIGYCPICGDKIFKFRHGRPTTPLGNYRQIKIIYETGTKAIFPSCMNCYEDILNRNFQDLSNKFSQYLKESSNKSNGDFQITNVEKIGTLKRIGLENGVKVWQ